MRQLPAVSRVSQRFPRSAALTKAEADLARLCAPIVVKGVPARGAPSANSGSLNPVLDFFPNGARTVTFHFRIWVTLPGQVS